MNIFNIFKTPQEQFYLFIKKKALEASGKKITISNLKVRVMTVQNTIDDFTEKYKDLEKKLDDSIINNDFIGVKRYTKEEEDLKLKLTALFRIRDEFKQDFIRGVNLKIKDLVDNQITTNTYYNEEIKELINTEIPSNYEKCVIFSDRLSNSFWHSGKHITKEEIKQF
jgi:hypothetical protein